MSVVAEERAALRAVAELLGTLLLREVDAPLLARLREDSVAAALREFGIELPSVADEEAWLEESAADFHELFLRPESGPLVQSLWTQGRYEGDATVRVRQLAEFAGVEFQPEAARGAAPDHLGSLLLLWAATDGEVQEVADEIGREHFEWAREPLRSVEAASGFYGALATPLMEILLPLGPIRSQAP